MERFFSTGTKLVVLIALVLFFGITIGLPVALQFLFSGGVVPERWQFENLPRWLQVMSAILVVFYLAGEVWCLCRRGPQTGQSHLQKDRGKTSDKRNPD